MQLSVADKKELLRIARVSIASVLSHQRGEGSEQSGASFTERCGAFVTLHLHGELRG